VNHALLAREAAAELGALDPKPEPAVVFQGPTRLIRVVDEAEKIEFWIDPLTGRKVEDG
jgi:Rad3-related DNA helicase